MQQIQHANNRIGTWITYLTDSDAIKKWWYWSDTDIDASTWCSPTHVQKVYACILIHMHSNTHGNVLPTKITQGNNIKDIWVFLENGYTTNQ